MTITVLYVVANLDVGGAERHIAQIIPKLDRSLVQPVLFTIINKGELAVHLENSGVAIIGDNEKYNWQHASKLQRIMCMLQSAKRLFTYMRRERPDVVHFFLPMPYLLGGIVSLLAGVNCRVMSRRSLNNYQKRYPGAALFERWLHRRMTRILGNSQAVLQDLRNEGGTEQQLGLIYNGVDIPKPLTIDTWADLRQQMGVKSTDLLIIIVANLIPYKGHEDLLRGLASVKSKIPDNWKLVCVGYDSHGIRAKLADLSTKLGIAEYVKFIGGRNDVISLLQTSDIAVLSSHQEGFSNAVIEGMAAGLPLVVTNVGGNAEAVRDEIDGYVVPSKNPQALGKAIATLLNDKALRKKMGEAGLRRVEEHFSVKACVNSYEKIYSDLLSKNI